MNHVGPSVSPWGELVGELHAAVLSPDRWGTALQAVCTELSATSVFFAVTTRELNELIFERSHPDARLAARDLLTLSQIPPGHPVVTEGGDPPHGLLLRLEVPDEPARPQVCLGVHRSRPFKDDGGLRELARHLRHVARNLIRLHRLEADNHCASALLDHLKLGVLLVDAGGGVQLANHSAVAILDESDGLSVRQGQLCPTDVNDRRSMREMLARVVSIGVGGALTITRSRGRQPLQLLFQSIDAAVALVFLTDPDGQSDGNVETLCELYGLTSAEARVAHAVVRGVGLPAVARALGVSITTVRTHLQQVFAKTGVHRQPELTRLLLCGPLQLRT